MKLFGRRKEDDKKGVECGHPVSHQVTLYEDPVDRSRVTGVKCSQCGETLPLRKAA